MSAVLPSLQAIADDENTSLLQFLLIVLVKLCQRCGFAALAKLLYSTFISMSDIEQSNVMSIEKSAYMMVSQELGRDRYTDLRSTLLSEGFEAQPWYKVNAHCESITPERIPVIINKNEGVCGYRYSFTDACKYSVNRALLASNIDSVPDKLYIGGKDGSDGSGQHYRRATVHVAVKGNILLYSFTPLLLCTGDDAAGAVLWRNTAPNSALTQRPLALIGAKENRDDVLRPFIPLIEEEIIVVSREGFNMTYMGKVVHVTVNSELSMFDGKMQEALQGTGGAFCQMCKSSKVYCHYIASVQTGFPVDRNISDMHSIFSMLTEEGTVPLCKKPDDYGTRAGVTAEPITRRDLNAGLSVTHAWLRCCSWFLNLLYHLACNDNTWGFGNKADLRFKKLMKAREKVQDTFALVLGVRIDAADGTGHTGNTLKGNLAKRFFSSECRKLLDSLIKEPQLSHIIKLHLNFEIILRLISSRDRRLDMLKFGDICMSTYIDILTYFKWADLTPTVHKVLGHATEVMTNNMSMGVGHLSEEGLEACHKIIRRFRANWTLQSSDEANLKDLIKKLWLSSDPLFYSYRRVIKCHKCGLIGHQKKCSNTKIIVNKSDLMVEDIFVD